jgi:septal ring factor EnvC (AmiA/AmiB activator)
MTARGDMDSTTTPDDERKLADEIEQTREQLGETVQALAAKADVKARAQDKVAELTGRLKDTAGQAASFARQRQVPLAAAAAAVTVLAWLVIRGKRR